jgi:hypothetical protein
MQSQFHVEHLSNNMHASNLHLNSLIQNKAAPQQAAVEPEA